MVYFFEFFSSEIGSFNEKEFKLVVSWWGGDITELSIVNTKLLRCNEHGLFWYIQTEK